MSKVPEDFNLRRHYLTEEKYKQEQTQQSSKCHIYYTAAFIFLLVVLFL